MNGQRPQNETEIKALRQQLLAKGPEAAKAIVAKNFADADDNTVAAWGGVISSLAQKLDDEEWVALVKHGKVPDVVPLSPRQMETVSGGWPSGGQWGGMAGISIGDAIIGSIGYLF